MITPKTKAVGLIGHPVAHSMSPQLHNHLYERLHIDMVYTAYDVRPEHVERAIEGMRVLGFTGFNVTIPHKETVYRLLNRVDTEAQVIGAVNTVRIEEGVLTGYNTDGQGFIQSLKEHGTALEGKRIVLLGAGGSARSIGIYLAKENPEVICLMNRTHQKAQNLAQVINDYKGYRIAEAVTALPAGADVIINTTNLGMWPHVKDNPLEGYVPASHTVVCDIVYNPRQTAMLQYASGFGCRTVGGMDMLIGQGLKAVEIWLGQSLPRSAWEIMFEVINAS